MTNHTSPLTLLLDDRAGHNAQTRGIARALSLHTQEITLQFNALARLPNALIRGASHLDAASKATLSQVKDGLVIATGRRMIPVLRTLKKRHPTLTCIYTMWARDALFCDLIIAPAHDNPPALPNVFITQGVLHGITPELLAHAKSEWAEKFSLLPLPRIAVLVGGDTKHAKFTLSDGAWFIARAQQIAGDGTLMVSTSRRTPADVAALIQQKLQPADIFYPAGSSEKNPYLGYLAHADAVIVSGDSLSMCCEATATGKPVFIHVPEGGVSKKHAALHASLYAAGTAQPLTHQSTLHWQPKPAPHEATQVAAYIKQFLTIS